LCQPTASFPTGFFNAIFACFFWGAIITLAITFHRVVISTSRDKSTYLQPWTSLAAGFFGGAISSALLLAVMTLVCDPQGIIALGWTDQPRQSNWFGYWKNIMFQTRDFWPYMIMGISLGVGMAMMSNKVFPSRAWNSFIAEQSSLTGKKTLIALIKLMGRFVWPIPLCMLVADFVAFYIVRTAPIVRDPSLIPNLPKPILINNIAEALFGGMAHNPEQVTAWKMSAWGQGLGILFDSATQAIGGFFCLVGMGLGFVVIQYGIKIEPRRK
jgi:hypothetical protein